MARPRTFDEQDVIRQARQVFHDHGYAPTSVQHLTDATGLSRSSLYGTFGDKHQLFLRSFAQYCDEETQVLQQEFAGDDRGARARVERHLHTKAANPAASQRGCLLAKTVAELGNTDPDVAHMAVKFYATYERALAECVRGAQAVGDLRADLDPDQAGALLLSVLRGIEALGRIGRPREDLIAMGDTAMAALRPTPA
jgi:TetR/AcrR family transcriptional repressor of nem operon